MTHITFDRLSELAELGGGPDGGIVARDDEARHLTDCADCRATIARVRSLLSAARSLPREVEPPPEVFDDPRWPSSCDVAEMAPYYRVAREVLGARPVPIDDGDRRIRRTKVFAATAERMGRRSRPVDVMVYFGDDPDDPLPPGTPATNRFGATQTSCTYCAE